MTKESRTPGIAFGPPYRYGRVVEKSILPTMSSTSLAPPSLAHRLFIHREPGVRRQLQALHMAVRADHSSIVRMSISVVDRDSGIIESFSESGGLPGIALTGFRARLDDVPSLARLAVSRSHRALADIPSPRQGAAAFANQYIRTLHCASSLTCPIHDDDRLLGFLFLDSLHRDYFNTDIVSRLRLVVAHVQALLTAEFRQVHGLLHTVRQSTRLVHVHDEETFGSDPAVGQHKQCYVRQAAR